ncbi:hypothetical protein GQ42DRAFT_162735 [Ramicandelaber brevisporus]|nr:hypothetical protein GQ42DRAFT_162735 [Ramicandelaber brevisporus]
MKTAFVAAVFAAAFIALSSAQRQACTDNCATTWTSCLTTAAGAPACQKNYVDCLGICQSIPATA